VRRRWALLGGGLAAALAACGGGLDADRLALDWRLLRARNRDLPRGIRVLEAVDPALPLRAFAVRVDEPLDSIETRVEFAANATRLEKLSDLAARVGATVAINAGYFRTDKQPARHVGLLARDARVVEPSIDAIQKGDQRYFLARATLGLRASGPPDVAWVSSREGKLFAHASPPANAPAVPGAALDWASLAPWDVRDAVAAGPVLVVDGRVRVTAGEEVFGDAVVKEAHPRSAAGVTPHGELVLVVVDGRQAESRGLTLAELAQAMVDLGCAEALNLDGGGSSALVVDGALVNRPEGQEVDREVMSALAVYAR
jgi:uncharacterized protein YigE (DUF2233 family)